MSTTRAAPPPLPSAPRPAQAGASRSIYASSSQTHAAFLFNQLFLILSQLQSSSSISQDDHQAIVARLERVQLKEAAGEVEKDENLMTEREKEAERGKRNAWVQKAISETSLLPTLVETALNMTAGPFLSDNQVDAIVQLVEMSQNKIAAAVTDPSLQRKAETGVGSGALSAGKGIRKGFASAGDKWENMLSKRLEKKEMEKSERQEKKRMKEELRAEREEIVRKRQQEILSGGGSSSTAAMSAAPERANDDDKPPSLSFATSLASSGTPSTFRDELSPTSTSLASAAPASRTLPPPPTSTSAKPVVAAEEPSRAKDHSITSAQDGLATATIDVLSLDGFDAPGSQSAASTSRFSPWPGLILTNTLVASRTSLDVPRGSSKDPAIESSTTRQANESRDLPLPPPPSRTSLSHPSQSTASSQQQLQWPS
ncbi:hypothetical protein IE81DRAFT_321331 [Ceraceosorus guamensis]|uniref:Uncharacterized protein n=1 Tax=Ceraceosorus guamensis TaxID=1522189 RepID=A0A316W3G4_9BASI|nr:hypothetical protein IE81DRAFT_321331 [Ceraceosorus guamensis]PWN44437.1 hypothetical protein IE81DRAFT_321331 [Ceraceosorus guamensis]